MENHAAGKAMGLAAEIAIKARTDQMAIELLDKICFPYKGCDAEFEAEDPLRPGFIHPEYNSYTDPNGPLGLLIAEAFGEPNRDYYTEWLQDEDSESWWDGPYGQFRQRYSFC
jgi:hypothetical protein